MTSCLQYIGVYMCYVCVNRFIPCNRARTYDVNQLWKWTHTSNFIYNWLQILERDRKNSRVCAGWRATVNPIAPMRARSEFRLTAWQGAERMRSRHHRRMRAQATALAHACLHAHLKNEIYIYIYVATHAALLSLHSPHVYTAKINYNGTLCKDTGTFVSTIATMSVLLLLLLSLCGGKQPHKYKCPKNISFPFFSSQSLPLSLSRSADTSAGGAGVWVNSTQKYFYYARGERVCVVLFVFFFFIILLISLASTMHRGQSRPRRRSTTAQNKPKQNVYKNGNILAVGHLALPGNHF